MSSDTHERRKKPRSSVKKSSKTRRGEERSPSRANVPTSAPVDGSFDRGDDFLAFFPSDSESGTSEAGRPSSPPQREWDAGKRLADSRRDRHRDEDSRNLRRVDAATRRCPWVLKVDWEKCNNVAEILHSEVEAFINFLSPTPEEHEVRGLIIQLISRTVASKFPDAKVLPFGSFETKLYLPSGDIDLVIQSESMAYSDRTNVLHAVANAIRKAGIADKVTIIAKAKVPIVKFVTTHGHFPVDVSINQLNGVAAGQMVNRFLGELPALRPLVLMVKSFLSQRSMNEVFTGGLGSYSIVCLCISFLQQHPKIRRGEIDPSKNLGVLVMEFFELYGIHFNYNDVGISVRDGGTYFNKAARGWSDYKNGGLLSVEDPGDISNDISRGSYGIARVRQTLAGAHSIMLASAFQRAEAIRSRKSGRYTSLRGGVTTPEEWSILASVMGVTQETINHRRVIQEVYEKRSLHRMVGIDSPAKRPSESRRPPISREPSAHSPLNETLTTGGSESESESGSESDSNSEREISGYKRTHQELSEDEEESRYTIAKSGRPSRKRARVGGAADDHTIFTADEEDGFSSDDGIGSEEEAYAVAADALADEQNEIPSSPRGREKSRHQRRSYWLSKGSINTHTHHHSDDD